MPWVDIAVQDASAERAKLSVAPPLYTDDQITESYDYQVADNALGFSVSKRCLDVITN